MLNTIFKYKGQCRINTALNPLGENKRGHEVPYPSEKNCLYLDFRVNPPYFRPGTPQKGFKKYERGWVEIEKLKNIYTLTNAG